MPPMPPPPAAVAPAASAPSASAARAALERRADDYVVARYYAPCGQGPGARLAAAGDRGWVALTADLMERARLGSACDGEALPQLLGEAMAHRPRVVLPYVDRSPRFSPERICLPERIEPSRQRVRRDVATLRGARCARFASRNWPPPAHVPGRLRPGAATSGLNRQVKPAS